MRPTGNSAVTALPSSLSRNHPDYLVLSRVARGVVKSAGSKESLRTLVGDVLRESIDTVVDTVRTRRRFLHDLEKTEKTYLGTRVEIGIRHALNLKRGTKLDFLINRCEVDCKFTSGVSWMIPREAVGEVCLLVLVNERASHFSLGLVVARREYMRQAGNQDLKGSLSAAGLKNTWWLLQRADYTPNFWQSVPEAAFRRILAPRTGNDRVAELLRTVQDTPVTGKILRDVGGTDQIDPRRRVRADGGKGTPSILQGEGLIVLSGARKKHRQFLSLAGLPSLKPGEYLSHRLSTAEIAIAARAGLNRNVP